MTLLALILACNSPHGTEAQTARSEALPPSSETSSQAPPLPPPVRVANRAQGEMVRYNGVEGYIAKRTDFEGDRAVLLTGSSRDPNHQREARDRAEESALVLLVNKSASLTEAQNYLSGLPGITQIEVSNIEENTP